MSQALSETETFELALEDKDGNAYTGRIIGTRIDSHANGHEVYLAEDGRVIFYDGEKLDYWVVDGPEQGLMEWPDALKALGFRVVVDL